MFNIFTKKVKACDVSNVVHRNLWKDSLNKFKSNKFAVVCLCILISLLLISLILPHFLPWSYDQIDWDITFPSPPDASHWLGTDTNGRDILTRSLYGIKVSFAVGILASTVSLIIGVTYGSIAGFVGGKVDQIMMRIIDVLMCLPFMFFVILLTVIFGRYFFLIFVVLGLVGWLLLARIVRAETISIKNKEFIEAAHSYGASNIRIVFRYIIPNVLGVIVVYLTLTIPEIILLESAISFIGLGIQEPMTSLGMLIAEGASQIEYYTWMFWTPALILALILFCFNFIGDGLRDALDPKQK